MTQRVIFRRDEVKFRVHFMYNTDLIDIMKSHNGWFFRKEKAWQFPIAKFNDVHDDIKQNHYITDIFKLEEKQRINKVPTQQSLDYWKDTKSFNVPGICKKCKQWHFLNNKVLCMDCTNVIDDE